MPDSPPAFPPNPSETHDSAVVSGTYAIPSTLSPPPQKVAPPEEPKASHKRWIWVSLSVLVLLALGVHFLRAKIPAPNSGTAASNGRGTGPPPIPVVATKSRKGDIGVYYSGLGTITPLATVTVHTRVDGQLMTVRYREGDTVHQGDLLAEIDDRPFQAVLTQAEGQLIRDQATLENARIDLVRYQQLVPLKAIPEQQLATQQATVHQDEGVAKFDQGQIESAKVNLLYCKITAPITGRIGLRLVDPGNVVHAADSNGLVVITQMDPISAIFTISEDQLQAVLQKMAAGQKLEVDAYDRDGRVKLAQGTLTTLDNQIDPTTGTLKLRATFNNAKETLFPNQFVNARLLVQEKRGVTLVSNAAIQRNSSATYVYVVQANSTVTVRQITIGTTEGDDSEVTSGLVPGEVLVMRGVDKLQEGSKVNAQIPAATPPAGTVAQPAVASPAAASPSKKGGTGQKGN